MAQAAAMMVPNPAAQGRVMGRYLMYGQIGSGGTSTVHFGRLQGTDGASGTVALKRLHPHLANDPFFASLLLSEAKLAARVRHRNVVSLRDVVRLDHGEALLVMDYVHGETLAALLGAARRQARPIPPAVAVAVMSGALQGLHAAHEAFGDDGRPLALVHGDVSPHNVIVGSDGMARVVDFGVAPASSAGAPRMIGTLSYMPPERLQRAPFDRRSDVFGAGAVLWEMLALARLFPGPAGRSVSARPREIVRPGQLRRGIPPALDTVVLRALSADPADRYPSALELVLALERACPPAPSREVAAWVAELCGARLRERALELARIEAAAESAPRQTTAELPATPSTDDGGPTEVADLDDVIRAAAEALAAADERPAPDGDTAVASEAAIEAAAHEAALAEAGREGPFRQAPRQQAAPHQAPAHEAPPHAQAPPHEAPPHEAPPHRPPVHQSTPVVAADVVFPHQFASFDAPETAPAANRRREAGDPATQVWQAMHPPVPLPTVPRRTMVALLGSKERRRRRSFPVLAGWRFGVATVLAIALGAGVSWMLIPGRDAGPAPQATASVPTGWEMPLASHSAVTERLPSPPLSPPSPVAELPSAELAPPEASATGGERGNHRVWSARAARPVRRRVAELNRRALAAYEQLDPARAMQLLDEALRRGEDLGARGRDLVARTHAYMGVVLSAGLKQADLAAAHFRRARALDPDIAPPAALLTPEVEAALAAAAGP